MNELGQQIRDVLERIEKLWQEAEQLSSPEKRSLIESLNDVAKTVKSLQVQAEKIPASQDELSETRQALDAERQRSQRLAKLVEERTAALSNLNEQLLQLNTDLEQQVQERTSELQQLLRFEAVLKRITDKVRDSLDESHIVQTALQELTQVLGIKGCDIAFFNTQETTSTVSYESTQGVPSTLGWVTPIAQFVEEYRQLQQHQCFQFCKLVPDLRGEVAILTCPIFDNQGVLGNLLLFKRREESFDAQEIRLAQQVANQCAIAIRQARLYQAAQAQVTELERLNQLKDDFLSTVSHELRTPVTNMKMAIHMLSRTLEQNQLLISQVGQPDAQRSKIERYFQILLNECERETSLINDLLDLQRLEAGVQPYVPAEIQLIDWLPPLLAPFEQRTRTRQQHFEADVSRNLPALMCDSASLERILTELLNNACKYTPPQETIKITVRSHHGTILIDVCNSGIVIPANELGLIFDKFYRIPKADRWQQGGTGLGLALVKKLIERMAGTIQVESEAGWTCFAIVLPLNSSKVSCS